LAARWPVAAGEAGRGDRAMTRLLRLLFLLGAAAAPQEGSGQAAQAPAPARAVDLSPERWPAKEREGLLAALPEWGRPKELARGRRGMVVGTTGGFAVRAGLEALAQGGSAVDAAYTTALAQIVLSGGAWNSFAGLNTLVFFEAKTGKVRALDGSFGIPLAETDPASIPARPEPSGRTALVPGFPAALQAAHDRFGKLPFAALFQPAIWLAEKGFPLPGYLARMMKARRDVLARRPATRAVFSGADGAWLEEGDLFRQPALAETLRRWSREGSAFLYRGDWARAFVEAVRQEGGRITLKDLERYRAEWVAPLHTTYRGLDVYGPGVPTIGGVQTLEALNLWEASGLAGGAAPGQGGEPLRTLMRITRLGHLLTWTPPALLAARLPGVDTSPQERVTPAFARGLWKKMLEPGWFAGLESFAAPGGGHSDAVIAVDAVGNVAAMVHTINTSLWGNTGIFVAGVSIPDSASFQGGKMVKAGPGGKVPSETNPVLVLREGRPLLASSCVGAGLIEATVQCLIDVLDHGRNPKQAAEAPRFFLPDFEAVGKGKPLVRQLVPEGRFPAEVLADLRAGGQPVLEVPRAREARYRGYWIGVLFDPETGAMQAGLPPDHNGLALGR